MIRFDRRAVVGGATAFIAYNIGVAVGIYMVKSYYKEKYQKDLERELALSKHYKDIKKIRKTEPEDIVEAEIVEDDGNPYDLPWNAYDLDYEEEMKHRSEETPYIISKNEYDNDKPEYEKIDFEYYPQENVLLDDRVEPIQDMDDLVGEENLKHFGKGSGDRRIVYIRNEFMESDFEIRLMMGSYVVDVLGLDDPNDQGKRWTPPHP